MSALSDKLRRAREIKVEAGPFVLTALRPTDVDMIRLNGSKDAIERSTLMASWVTGWAKKDGSDVTEVDLGIVNGDPHALPFDPEAFRDFLFDNVTVFSPVAEAITDAYAEHTKATGDASKN